jgi:organic radical activating enzyme
MGYLFPVSEIFESIQGEGNQVGMRVLFVRFQFCNLHCIWCDTKYTWYRDSGYYKWYSTDELKKIIRDKDIKQVIFTGGEPGLFSLDKLVDTGFKYHVETNGTFIPDRPMEIILKDGSLIQRESMNKEIISSFNWIVSPKLSNSQQKLDTETLKYWSGQDFCIFKFICSIERDLDEIEKTVQNFKIDKNKVYIGLEGLTLKSQLQPGMVDKIVAMGFNFSPRLHIMLWGATRRK